jgi:hypothetical protein
LPVNTSKTDPLPPAQCDPLSTAQIDPLNICNRISCFSSKKG